MISKNKQRITVTLDKDILSYIRYKAEKENLTVSEYVNNIFKYSNVSFSFLDSCGKCQTGKVTMDGVFIDE